MEKLQTLTLQEIKCKARDAYMAKKLTAQHPDPEERRCVYETRDGYHCVIGSALSKETLNALNLDPAAISPGSKIDKLVDFPICEYGAIMKLQMVYDRWASSAMFGDDRSSCETKKQEFLKAIYS